MISMNISPPLAIAERKVERVPKLKARMRNRGRRNIGSNARRSITAKAVRSATEAPTRISTRALIQPVE